MSIVGCESTIVRVEANGLGGEVLVANCPHGGESTRGRIIQAANRLGGETPRGELAGGEKSIHKSSYQLGLWSAINLILPVPGCTYTPRLRGS